MLRICKVCGEEKERQLFRKNGNWYCHICKACSNKERRITNLNKPIEEKKSERDLIKNRKQKRRDGNIQLLHFNFECLEDAGRLCRCCNKYYPIHCFKKDIRFKSGYSKNCLTCMGETTINVKKLCSKCGNEKYLHQYRKDVMTKDGRFSICCECSAEKERQLSSDPKVKEKNRKKCMIYRENHLEYDIRRCQVYKNENEDIVTEYADRTKDTKKIKSAEYYKIPENKKKKNTYKTNRLENNEQYRITETLRARLRSAFNDQGLKKTKRACEYGVDWKMLSEYLEPLKPKDVNIKLSIDHIIPCSLFDMTNEEHIRLCYLKENLRWCSFSENSTKNNYIIPNLIRKYNLVWLTDYLGINLELHEKENKRIAKYYKQED